VRLWLAFSADHGGYAVGYSDCDAGMAVVLDHLKSMETAKAIRDLLNSDEANASSAIN
jgi:hypothetical protein